MLLLLRVSLRFQVLLLPLLHLAASLNPRQVLRNALLEATRSVAESRRQLESQEKKRTVERDKIAELERMMLMGGQEIGRRPPPAFSSVPRVLNLRPSPSLCAAPSSSCALTVVHSAVVCRLHLHLLAHNPVPAT